MSSRCSPVEIREKIGNNFGTLSEQLRCMFVRERLPDARETGVK